MGKSRTGALQRSCPHALSCTHRLLGLPGDAAFGWGVRKPALGFWSSHYPEYVKINFVLANDQSWQVGLSPLLLICSYRFFCHFLSHFCLPCPCFHLHHLLLQLPSCATPMSGAVLMGAETPGALEDADPSTRDFVCGYPVHFLHSPRGKLHPLSVCCCSTSASPINLCPGCVPDLVLYKP